MTALRQISAHGPTLYITRGRIQFLWQTKRNVAHFLSIQVYQSVLDIAGVKDHYALTLSWHRDTVGPKRLVYKLESERALGGNG